MNVSTGDRAFKASAWLLYTLIVLEILFMVSPFAAYYYSIYAAPLNALQQSPLTAWLTMYLLPHFTYSESWLANGLLLLSWPLILIGIVLFVFGFCQIYWAKITRQGAVEVGLYRYIRHPQYVALAVIGLGASLYWSRFIVVIAFVSMLCLYYYLARLEERICLEKFGQSYRRYLDRTGMFLPPGWESSWQALDWQLPDRLWVRAVTYMGVYAAVIGLTIGTAYLLRIHVIASLQADHAEERVTVYLAPLGAPARATVASVLNNKSLPGDVAYVAPASWRVPELGLKRSAASLPGGSFDEFLHPSTHGNSLSYDESRLSIVLVNSVSPEARLSGSALFEQAISIKPIETLELDVAAGEIVGRRPAGDGQWAGIPVPTF